MACVKTWDFTYFSDEDKVDLIRNTIKNDCVHWAFQHEKGEESGRYHYQGRIQLRKKKRVNQIIELFASIHGAHWSPTANVNKQNFNYAMKTDTRVAGPWTDKDKVEEPKFLTREAKVLMEKGLYPWQESIKKSCDDQKGDTTYDGRSINVLVDEGGNSGKGSLAAYARYTGFAQTLPTVSDMKQLVGFAMDLPHHAYIFDWPKAMVKKEMKQFFAAVETIKDGWLWDVRNKGRQIVMDRPAIWIFTNKKPDTTLLSMDRWRMWTICKTTKELILLKDMGSDEPPAKRQKTQ